MTAVPVKSQEGCNLVDNWVPPPYLICIIMALVDLIRLILLKGPRFFKNLHQQNICDSKR